MRQLLKDLAVICAGQGAPQGDNNYCENGTPFVKAGNLQELLEGKAITSIQKVSDEVAKKHKLKLYPKGTILFAKSGMSCMKGYVYVLPQSAYVVSHLACVTPNEDASEYLRYFFNYHKPNQLVKDAAYPSISLSDIGNLVVDMKSESERNAIVSVLQHAESVITLRQKELQKLDDLVKARFVEMFGDMYLNTMEWRELQLETMADIVSGITKGRKIAGKQLTKVPYMAVSNVKDGYIDWTTVKTIEATDQEINQYRLLPDDVLMTEGGDPDKLGRGAIIRTPLENCIHQNHIFRVRLDESHILPDYFAEYLKHQRAKRYFLGCAKQTTGIASINMKQLKALPVLLPPLELQNEFSAFIRQIDKSKVVESIHRMNVLFNITLNGGNRYDIRANEF